MTKKFGSLVIGIGLLLLSVGCSAGSTPVVPSNSTMNVLDSGSQSLASTTYPYTYITLEPDLTANPATTTVRAGYRVRMVNHSHLYVAIQSNCYEFNTMDLRPGGAWSTFPFSYARIGTACDYYAWNENWTQKIFVGRVNVVQ
jgi:hypothetical protein